MVAQSSVEASLTIMFTLPSCVPPPLGSELALELEPHATENRGIAAMTSPKKIRDNLEFIFVSCEDSMVSTRLYRPMADINAPGPDNRAKISASTIQNTEAGIELRWDGAEAVVRKYYSEEYWKLRFGVSGCGSPLPLRLDDQLDHFANRAVAA